MTFYSDIIYHTEENEPKLSNNHLKNIGHIYIFSVVAKMPLNQDFKNPE